MNAPTLIEQRRRFINAYGEHRTAEGHGALGDRDLLSLPYLRQGRLAGAWQIRARTYDAFTNVVVNPLAEELERALAVLDAGAGNGWLSHRLAQSGHACTALDLRATGGDSLHTAARYAPFLPSMFARTAGDFASLPFADRTFDVVVFNASLHYALDLAAVLSEAHRVLQSGGRIVILDSPFYASAHHGEAMVAEKRRNSTRLFGERSDVLMSLPFIEYLTGNRLVEDSRDLNLTWQRHRVRYPLRYELRPLVAALRRKRPPSRFDLWTGRTDHAGHG